MNLEALIRRNAESCAQAKRFACKCHCKGALHRKPHSEEWIRATIAELTKQPELELELKPSPGTEYWDNKMGEEP